MDINKIAADIDFIGNSIKSIKVNNSVINLSKDAKYSFGLDIAIARIKKDENGGLTGYVELVTTVNAKVKKLKSKFEILLEGCFFTSSLSEEDFIQMLYVNGGSTLYSIARSLILNISANVYQNGKIVLPMINMVQFLNEKIAREKQESLQKPDQPNVEETVK